MCADCRSEPGPKRRETDEKNRSDRKRDRSAIGAQEGAGSKIAKRSEELHRGMPASRLLLES